MDDLVGQVIKYLQSNRGIVSIQVGEEILERLKEVISNDGQTELADSMAAKPKSVESLFAFASWVLQDLFEGRGSALVACLAPVLHCLMCWTDKSQLFCQVVIKEGLIFECVDMLNKLGRAALNEYVASLISMNIGIIYNCAREDLFIVYQGKVTWATLLQHWMKSSQPEIKLQCMFLLGYLASYLSQSDHSKLLSCWSQEDMKSVMHLLTSSTMTTALTAKFHGTLFSADELLVNILNLGQLSKENYAVVASPEMIKTYISLLQKGSNAVIFRTCQILWTLCDDTSFRDIAFSDTSLSKEVNRICQSTENDVKLIGECLQITIQREPICLGLALNYIEGCCKYKQYQMCVNEVEKHLHTANEDNKMKLKFLSGKALFLLYTKEKSRLVSNAKSMPPNHFFTAHSACFSKLGDIITVLGDVLDHHQLDSEGSRMLDFAMMDCICETNKLYECNRCYLCRDNLNSRAMSSRRKEKLANSHVFPKSILNRFASAVPIPKNKRIFDNLIPGLGRKFDKEQPASAKELSVYMLCYRCEESLSRDGENWFVTCFFDKLYDPSNNCQEQNIPYNYKLYLFSVGIIFRTLYWSWDRFINSEELYRLLLQCRSCLLNVNSLSDMEKPEVYLLISPLTADKEDLAHGFMNQVLTSTCNLNVGCIDLETGELLPKNSLKASFVLVHIGMVNFLVKLTPSSAVYIPSQFLINPNGGQYSVPAEENRRGILPRGIWAAFKFMAQEFEASWYEHLNKPYLMSERQDKILPEASAADSYGIVAGAMQELSLSSSRTSSTRAPDQVKVVNFLPEMFHIRSKQFPDDVVLPEGHRILLHHTFKQETQNTSIFLAVGDTGNFSFERPYVLWHISKPGLQKSFGFFISTENLEGTELLKDAKEKYFVVNPDAEVKEILLTTAPLLLKKLLLVKGFYSVKSLLHRVHLLQKVSADLTCDVSCWYCANRCKRCLKEASPELTLKEENETRLKFCSKECQTLSTLFGSEIATAMHVVTANGKVFGLGQHSSMSSFTYMPKCSPVGKSHSIRLHIFVQAESSKGFLVEKQLLLCVGDGTEGVDKGTMYVSQWSRSLSSQNFLEYYVAEDFSPTAPLGSEPIAVELVELAKSQGDCKIYLQRAMKAVMDFEETS